MEVKRREFLKIFGGMTGAMVLGGCGQEDLFRIPEALVKRAKAGPGVESWVNTVCGLCTGGCGVSVRRVDGIPVYVKGNPLHPVNKGGMCPLGLNGLHVLYHPDRLTGPVRRIGKPGSGSWAPLSWDEALSQVSEQLVKLRNEGKPHQVGFLGHVERGLMREHIARFMQAYGSPNYAQFSAFQNQETAYELQHGHAREPAYDVLNARLIVSFGANFLEDGHSPIYYTKLYSHHQERQTKYIQVESRISLTAANADQWIPIRPGTYGALALGLAYVLIREELYDADFVEKHTFGFEDWVDRAGQKHVGFRNMVLGNYYPDIVSETTGVPSSVILGLARELGTTRPSVVVGDQGVVNNTNGTYALMAVHSLNALLGNPGKEGGTFFVDDPPFASMGAPPMDPVARQGYRQPRLGLPAETTFPLTRFSMDSFIRNVLAGRPYPLSVLFLYKGNPLFQTVNRTDFTEALKKIPLIISFDSMITETSEHAHLILPDHTFLEKWDECANVPSVGFAHVSVQQPVIEPLYETRHVGDVLMELARQVGGTVGAAFPGASYEQEIQQRMRGIYNSGEGAVVSAGVQRSWIEYLQQRGWQVGRYASFEEFWRLLLEKGGWWNPIRKQNEPGRLFKTPSGKFELYSQQLKKTIDELVGKGGPEDISYRTEFVLSQLNISARGDTVFLPHHEPVPQDGERPLQLITFRLLSNHDGDAAALPMMQEMFGYSTRAYWTSWAELHPETAARHGITDGGWVWVESSVGSLKLQAKIIPGIMPGVVAIPFGMGHRSNGRYAAGHGVNPHDIMKNLYDLLNGRPAVEATRVRISPLA